jgi:hypothetical protein
MLPATGTQDKLTPHPVSAIEPIIYRVGQINGELWLASSTQVLAWRPESARPRAVAGTEGKVVAFQSNQKGLWIASEKGLYLTTAGEDPIATGLAIKGITSLGQSEDGSSLFFATDSTLYRLDGMDGSKWAADVEMDPLSPAPVYAGEAISVQWHIKDYLHRTTSVLVKYRVIIYSDSDGQHSYAETSLAPGETNGTITAPRLAGTYYVGVIATDLHGKEVVSSPLHKLVVQRPVSARVIPLLALVCVLLGIMSFVSFRDKLYRLGLSLLSLSATGSTKPKGKTILCLSRTLEQMSGSSTAWTVAQNSCSRPRAGLPLALILSRSRRSFRKGAGLFRYA